MLATYGTFLALLSAAALVGQALFAVCGRRRWCWLAPAVGLALLLALAWGTVRLPGHATTAAIAIGLACAVALAVTWRRVEGGRQALLVAAPVAVAAAALASLPFMVEGRFGILGTGLNPDMSQHLFAADRLAGGGSERLIASGYPLGPHSLVVAAGALGVELVHGFDGLTLVVAGATALAPMGLLAGLPPWRRALGALLVAFAYMVASQLIQGAFKETLEALFVLAFAIGLHDLGHGELVDRGRGRRTALAAVPLAALAIGTVYAYSFPGLLWLCGGAAIWGLAEVASAVHQRRPKPIVGPAREALLPAAVAVAALVAAVAPELGRMVDFASFETFNPSGPGLGNLFNRISPFEALGIWPSGDFRLDPGAGAAPAVAFYAGCVLASLALGFGLAWWLRRREPAVPAVLVAAALLIAYAGLAGTPYQEAKAIAVAAPLAMLISVRALLAAVTPGQVTKILRRRGMASLFPRSARLARLRLAIVALATAFVGAAAGCSALALVNGPVGPPRYSPALTELRPLHGSTLVLARPALLAAHGRDFIAWELRGGRVCVAAVDSPRRRVARRGISWVITSGRRRPYGDLRRVERRDGLVVWRVAPAPRGHGSCPLISPAARAEVVARSPTRSGPG